MSVKVKVQDKQCRLVLIKTAPKTTESQILFSEPKKKRARKKLTLKQMHSTIVDNQEHGQRLAWRFLKSWHVRLHPDEVRSIVGLALAEAATRFDPSKNVAFKTFLFYHLRGMLLKEITRLVQESRLSEYLVGQEYTYSSSGNYEEAPENLVMDIWPLSNIEQKTPELLMHKREIARLCWQAFLCIDDLEKEVIYRHYVDDQSLKIIAKELNYCRCHISRVKSRAINKLKKVVSKSTQLRELFLQKAEQLSERKGSKQHKKMGYTGGRGRRTIPTDIKKSTAVEKKLKLAS